MKQFKIYVNADEEIKPIKQGWSWLPAFFNSLWALYNKMWLIGILVLVIGITLGVVLFLFESEIPAKTASGMTTVWNIVVFILFGMNGNKWKEGFLIKKGFELKDIIVAKNADDASSIYLKKKLENVKEIPMNDLQEIPIIEEKTSEKKPNPSLNEIKQLLVKMQDDEAQEVVKTAKELPISKKEDSTSSKIAEYLKEIKILTPYIKKLGFQIDEIEIDLISINSLIFCVSQNQEVSVEEQERILKYCQNQKISLTLLLAIREALRIENNETSSTKIEIDLTSSKPSIIMKLTNLVR